MKTNNLIKTGIALLLIFSMVILVACSNDSKNKATSNSIKSKNEKSNPYSNIKIGVINIGSSKDSSGYTFAHVSGIKKMLKDLNMKEEQVIYKDNIPSKAKDKAIIKKAIQDCIDSGCKIIFATSSGFQQAVTEMATKYPKIYFSHCSGNGSNGKNFNRYFGKIYQPFYLAGIAAGLKTKSNKIGFVSTWGKNVSMSAYCLDAFAMGVESVNKKASVLSYSINSSGNKTLEETATKILISKGADVIAADTNTTKPQVIAQKYNKWSIGYNSDMTKDTQKNTLLSVIWDWSAYYTYAVKEMANGSWKCPNYFGGIKEGVVGISDLASFNAPKTETSINAVIEKFKSGKWDIFTDVLPTNDGKLVGKPDASFTDDDIQFSTTWLYKNIIVIK